jgi:transcriptional regulator with XRE-family HTH domain
VSTTSNDPTYAQEVGSRLRAIRAQKGLSLAQLEAQSHGRWKAAVVASYERGDRNASVARLAALADFYGVPVRAFLPGRQPDPGTPRAGRVVLNLPALARLDSPDAGPLRRWVAEIQRARGDYGGQVLSIRTGDLNSLATLYTLTRSELLDQLTRWQSSIPPATSPPQPPQADPPRSAGGRLPERSTEQGSRPGSTAPPPVSMTCSTAGQMPTPSTSARSSFRLARLPRRAAPPPSLPCLCCARPRHACRGVGAAVFPPLFLEGDRDGRIAPSRPSAGRRPPTADDVGRRT